jgi:metallo-beta-lactamase class B
MFASLALLLAAQQIVVPFGTPPRVERLPAPLKENGPLWASVCAGSDDWNKPAPPVRIAGSTYLVGTCGISSILIAGNAGHVLIDAGTEQSADAVADNIKALGFKLADIRIILISHEHHDHVGGIARLQQLTGANLYVAPAARTVMNSGKADAGDPQASILKGFPAARVDGAVTDGQQVRLGNIMLTAIATPGHTAGATSWRWVSCDGGVCPNFVYADSLSPVSAEGYRFSDHPQLVAAFRASIAKIAAQPCDLLLTPHPAASDMPARLALKAPMRDENACKAFAAAKTGALDARLAKEAAAQ